MVVSNYKEMCFLLGEEVKTGNGKMYQIKNWSNYFKYKRDGHKFIISKVYDTPLNKVDGRAGRKISRRNGELLNLIEPMLMDIIRFPENNGEIIMSKIELYTRLGMVNERYKDNSTLFDDIDNVKDKTIRIGNKDIDYYQLMYFYEVTNGVFSASLRSSLNSLVKRQIVTFDNWYEIKFKNGKRFVASVEETGKINEIQQETLDSIGVNNLGKAFMMGNRRKYFQKRSNFVKETRDWEKVFNVVKIYLESDLDTLDSNEIIYTVKKSGSSYEGLMRDLNEVIISKVLAAIDRDRQRICSSNDEIKNEVYKNVFENKDVMEIQSALVDNLIRLPLS